MFPVFMAKTTGFLFIIAGVTALLGAFSQINPIWQFGPYEASRISYAVQPDWYMGWLDGALRIMPSWEFVGFGHTIPFEVFMPAIIFPGIIFNICYVVAVDRAEVHQGQRDAQPARPPERPTEAHGRGVAVLALLGMLFIASATDVLANFFHISLNTVLVAMRILVVVVPFVSYPSRTRSVKELQARPRRR